ncbi:hypothetical protein Afil01_13080 [Actinorhabdospora filicis]|uniref:Fibronectin type-III domain-containing protein n=1 Tax=Actinorhabdospora filicis TaxID=1785913 RepID=A0A9W6SJ27_9ACTN|nr:fibronectin type III domain-containing protein [Actinorhabdospora filicis]GLZ76501.1 hypothetical protein Afil01_13080 [Actinorhabdospora filicis]
MSEGRWRYGGPERLRSAAGTVRGRVASATGVLIAAGLVVVVLGATLLMVSLREDRAPAAGPKPGADVSLAERTENPVAGPRPSTSPSAVPPSSPDSPPPAAPGKNPPKASSPSQMPPPAGDPPGMVHNLAVTALGGGRFRVTWTAVSDDGGLPVTGHVLRDATDDAYITTVGADTFETVITRPGLTSIAVRAQNAAGEGEWAVDQI